MCHIHNLALTKTILDIAKEIIQEQERPVSSADIVSQIIKQTGSTESTIRGVLSRKVKDGELSQPKRGYYSLPTSTPTKHTKSPRGYMRDSRVSYQVFDVGVGAGPASVQQQTGEILVAPKSIIRGWTGGSVPENNEAYWTKVRGTSMEPWLPDGSPILVVKCNEVIQGGRYVIYLDDSDAEVVKRVEKLGGNVLRIISDNPSHSTQTFRHLEDDMYRDEENRITARIRVGGVVVYPKDTGYAITRMITGTMR